MSRSFSGLLYPKSHLEFLKTPGVIEILRNKSGPNLIPDEQVENIRIFEKHFGDVFLVQI